MSDETPTAIEDVEELLDRLQQAHFALMAVIADIAPEQFERENEEGDSIRRILERSTDEVNFYYGRLVSRAVSLPQPPDMEASDLQSPREAMASLEVAHRRLSRLLHDVTAEDLHRTTRLESTAEYTLRQVLETAVAHYRLRADQIRNMSGDQQKGGPNDPHHRR